MSWQRAVVNCMRCYRTFGRLDRMSQNSGGIFEDLLYSARNEALQALEHVIDNHFELNGDLFIGDAHRALDACMDCELRQPYIARIYDELVNDSESV